jgi:glycolate oxidase iron-sulfur subunit
MMGLAEGKIEATASVRQHLDLCLDCRGCETACPSGVVYHELIEETRARLYEAPKTFEGRFMRWVFFNIFIYPTRLKLALLPARIMQRIGLYALLRKTGLFNILPPQLRKMEQMLPASGKFWPGTLPENVPSVAKAKARVGFFPGCIGSVMFESVNRQAVELLSASGATVITPRSQGCCGAIHHHNGAHHPAERLAKNNIDTFLPKTGPQVDYIATCIAGCGAMLKEYDFLLRDDPEYSERAKLFSSKVRDVSEVLADLDLPELKYPVNETVTYHDACHLAHAQKVTAQPRALLAKIPGLKLVSLPESDVCCGAAGTYNLTQPKMATDLAERKLRNIATTGAATCATGNVGCAMQIQSEADARGQKLTVVHPVELLHRAAFGDRPS